MSPWEEFEIWMQKHKDNYLNNYSILFNRKPEFVFVESPWPDHGDVGSLSIALLCANGKELFETLNIEIADDIELVQPEDMLNLFYTGEAMVLCTAGEGRTLQFQKVNDTMIAVIDGEDIGHEVKEQLIVSGDFHRYTEQYFHFLDESNEESEEE